MEGSGVAGACGATGVEYLLVKAIWDFGGLDGVKRSKHQWFAGAGCASLVRHVLSSRLALGGLMEASGPHLSSSKTHLGHEALVWAGEGSVRIYWCFQLALGTL